MRLIDTRHSWTHVSKERHSIQAAHSENVLQCVIGQY